MSYQMIVLTLEEFGLITVEQAEQALAKYDDEYEEVKQRAKVFQAEWERRTPWWKRWWDPSGWRMEFWESERQ